LKPRNPKQIYLEDEAKEVEAEGNGKYFEGWMEAAATAQDLRRKNKNVTANPL
jgi:hypothetical protein